MSITRRVDITETLNEIARATSASCEMCDLAWHREMHQREQIAELTTNLERTTSGRLLWRSAFFAVLIVAVISIGERMVKP